MKNKIFYRDYIAMLVAFFIGVFLSPEIQFPDVKYFGLAILFVLSWYLGATREEPSPGRKKK